MRTYEYDTLASWRKALAAGTASAPPAEAVKVYIPDEIESLDGGDKRQIRFRITTGTPDRMRDTIDPKGWDLKHYKKNPIVLFAHDYSQLPVARAVKIEADDKGLSSVAQFATKEQYAFADTVYQLILGGFLKATSVGFKPQKHVYNEARGGVDFLEQELLEYSIVPIPANPEALLEADAKGISIHPLREWAERLLDSIDDEPGVWVPRRQVEIMLAALPDHGKTVSLPTTFTVTSNGATVAATSGFVQVDLSADDVVGKPLSGVHACELTPPDRYSTFRTQERDHNGKKYQVLFGKLKDSGKMEEHSFHYPKSTWTTDEARSHCKSHDGTFAPASGKAEQKGKAKCPRGQNCPANEGVPGCPEQDQCPMGEGLQGHSVPESDLATRARELVAAGETDAALALFREAEPVVEVLAPDPTVRRLSIDEDDLVILELADEDDVDPDELRAVLAETIPVLVRETLNKLRGRVD